MNQQPRNGLAWGKLFTKSAALRGTCWRCGKSAKLPGHDKCQPKDLKK